MSEVVEVDSKKRKRTNLDESLMSYLKFKANQVHDILEEWTHKELDEDMTLGFGFRVRSKNDGMYRLNCGEVRIVGVTTEKIYRHYPM